MTIKAISLKMFRIKMKQSMTGVNPAVMTLQLWTPAMTNSARLVTPTTGMRT